MIFAKMVSRDLVILVFCILLGFTEGKPCNDQVSQKSCGYQSCNQAKANELNVHLVPHSHDDVGWLKTVDQYFYGTRNNIQRADVNSIISSVVKALKENRDRRFIQVETAFFYKWWQEQPEDIRLEVKKLVDNGQLEFTGGAWSMNDEGAVHYQSIIDQFTFGLRFLNDTFGECARPKIGWQIDPFGHSSEMASIFAQMGYDGIFFARLDWRDKTKRLQTKTAEMIWQGSRSLGNSSNIFTSVLYNHYSAPKGFCFDVLCTEDPIVTNSESTEYNFKNKTEKFAEFIREQAKYYKTNNILITMGDDFNYQDAIYYYRNMDTLINGFKQWPQKYNDFKINVFYSTPSCYVKAVNDAVNNQKIELPLETHDFFPYASDYHAYWSGYYTSRPASKFSERRANKLLQMHKQWIAFLVQDPTSDQLFKMQDAVGIMQHHDAITGTEKQHVADDYARILHEAFQNTPEMMSAHISRLLSKDSGKPVKLELKECLLKNSSICLGTSQENFDVWVYNPIARTIIYPIRIPVNFTDFKVTGPNNEIIASQVSPSIISKSNRSTHHLNKYELTFIAKLGPLGLRNFNVQRLSTKNTLKPDSSRRMYKLGGKNLSVNIHPPTGLLQAASINGIELKLRQELLYYLSAQGDNSVFENRASGAYIFRSRYNAVQINQKPINVTTYRGEVYDEVHQVFSSWAKQVIRLYHGDDHVEFDWVVGPIPVEDLQGKEVISRFSSEMMTWEDFYTDSNGREMLHRVRDSRPTYNYTKEEPISGNYYPVTSQLTITDGNVRMSLLNDRAQGGSSLQSGQIELMVHRRMLYDDAFGVGEALNETEDDEGLIVRGKHYLTFTKEDDQKTERHLAEKLALSPYVFISEPREPLQVNGLTTDLPEDIRLLTLEPIPDQKDTLLLRLENFFASDIGKTSSVSLKNLFMSFEITSIREMNLAGNIPKDELSQLKWNQYAQKSQSNNVDDNQLIVHLEPMQIRTFIVRVDRK